MPIRQIDAVTKMETLIVRLTTRTLQGKIVWHEAPENRFVTSFGTNMAVISNPIPITIVPEYTLDLYVKRMDMPEVSVVRNKFYDTSFTLQLEELYKTVRRVVYRSDDKLDQLLAELENL